MATRKPCALNLQQYPDMAIGADRLFPGNINTGGGGGGGGLDSQIITGQTINSGTTVVAHALGAAPNTVLVFNANGQVQVLQWVPTPGSETTSITITSFVSIANTTVQLSKSA
jgi:hypothetical protein